MLRSALPPPVEKACVGVVILISYYWLVLIGRKAFKKLFGKGATKGKGQGSAAKKAA